MKTHAEACEAKAQWLLDVAECAEEENDCGDNESGLVAIVWEDAREAARLLRESALRERALIEAADAIAHEAHTAGRIYGRDGITVEEIAAIERMVGHKIHAALASLENADD